jgi:hypothetical protein
MINVTPSFLGNLALEVAQGARSPYVDAITYALMATHVSEIINKADNDEELLLTMAASLVMLLVENFELQREALK